MSRTSKSRSYRRDRNLKTVNTHHRVAGDKYDLKRHTNKYGLRTYSNPEHVQYCQALEEYEENIYDFHNYCDWEDRTADSVLGNGLEAFNRHMLHSYLHHIKFVDGLLDPSNTNEHVCVWKEH